MRPATPDEVVEALAFALRYRGRARTHDADGFMARAAAERLLEHLERSGFVLMRKPAAPDHTAPTAPPGRPP
jgi:hypothetical protein